MTDETPNKKSQNYTGPKTGTSEPEAAGDKPKLARVTTTDPIVKKTPLGRKIAGAFKGDDIKSVGNYIVMEVLVPQAKSAIADAFTSGIERLLFGDSRRTSTSTRAGYTAYNRMSPSGATVVRPGTAVQPAQASVGRSDFAEVIVNNRGEAELVLDTLREQVDLYNSATVADLYELVGMSVKFTYNKWGWTDLREAGVRRVPQGYLIDVPAPKQLS